MKVVDYYLKRTVNADETHGPTVESELRDKAWEWLTKERGAGWVSLCSAPGRGNTSFLRHFQQEVQHEEYTLADTRTILIDGSLGARTREPAPLAPIADAVHHLYESRPGHVYMAAWKHWRVIFLCFLVIISIAGGIAIEAMLKESPLGLFELAFWRAMTGSYIVNWPKVIQLIVVGGILAALFERLTHLVRRLISGRRKHVESTVDAQSRQELTLNNYDAEFIQELEPLCRGWRALILLVDNSAMLPDQDRQLLEDLFDPPRDKSPVSKFAQRIRILIITLDFEGREWSMRPSKHLEQLNIRDFTDLERHDIYFAHYPTRTSEDFDRLLETARTHISLLFDISAISLDVIRQYNKAREGGSANEFGLQRLMAYWSVRDLVSVDKAGMFRWLKGLPSNYLNYFGLLRPKHSDLMVKRFSRCALVRRVGGIFYFEPIAIRGLRSFLKERDPGVLAEAHFFWAVQFGTAPQTQSDGTDRHTLTSTEELAIKQGAWHAAQIGILLDSPTALLSISGANPSRTWRAQIADLLLRAASIWRDHGDVTESDDLVEDTFDWIRGLGNPDELLLATRCIEELWKNYWIAGDPGTRRKLDTISSEWSAVTETSEWLVNSRYEEVLRSKIVASSPPVLAADVPRELQNLLTVTELFLSIRLTHGFLVPALRDRAISTPLPVDSDNSWPEAALWQLRVAAANRRMDRATLEETFARWRERLLAVREETAAIGRHAQHQYQKARFWHLVCEVWRVQIRVIDERHDDDTEQDRRDLADLCGRLCLVGPPDNQPVQEYAFEQAQICYERSLELAALMHRQALGMETAFHFGVLLLQHTPDHRRTQDPPWWRTWEQLFDSCLGIERTLGWSSHTPAIHRLRWEFFEKIDRPTSVDDIFNTFQAVKDSNYPVKVILEWHARAKTSLNNYGDDPEDRRRSANLNEIWARELVGLKEAESSRTFKKCLNYERAYSLSFVCQALRQMNEFARAKDILDEADALVRDATEDPAATEEHPKAVRELKTGLRMQRAWLSTATEDRDTSRAILRQTWSEVEPGDYHNANLLASIVGFERELRLLDNPWPPPGCNVFEDHENLKLSLPQEWFRTQPTVRIATRFEFRLRQLLRMVSWRADPSAEELSLAALAGWWGLERFGEAVLLFAEIAYDDGLLLKTRGLIISALFATAEHFARFDPDDEQEIRCLQLILHYEPKSQAHRVRYIEVLERHAELIERELKLKSAAQIDWLDLARRADYLFSVLTDPNKLNVQLAGELSRRGQSVHNFLDDKERRRQVLTLARKRIAASDFEIALQELQPYLPPKDVQFVLFQDVECLDLWLRCSVNTSPNNPEFSQRATQLRELARRYIGQYSRLVSEPDVQHLALELLDATGQAQGRTLPPGRTDRLYRPVESNM